MAGFVSDRFNICYLDKGGMAADDFCEFGGDVAKREVKSEMAGTVFQISAKVGDAIAADGDLVILEAMKMEIPVPSPAAGKVVAIHVAEGAVVNEGDLIATIET